MVTPCWTVACKRKKRVCEAGLEQLDRGCEHTEESVRFADLMGAILGEPPKLIDIGAIHKHHERYWDCSRTCVSAMMSNQKIKIVDWELWLACHDATITIAMQPAWAWTLIRSSTYFPASAKDSERSVVPLWSWLRFQNVERVFICKFLFFKCF